MIAERTSIILLIALAMHVSYFAFSGVVLFIKNREQHDRSRILFSLVCFALTLCAFSFIWIALMKDNITEHFSTILELYPPIFAFPLYLLIPAYITEILRPNWLQIKHFILLLIPWMVTCVAFFIWYVMQSRGQLVITPIHSWNELVRSIDQPDVIFRLIFTLYYLLYPLCTFLIPYDPKHSNVSLRWKWILQSIVMLIAIGFVVGVQFRVIGIMITYWATIDALIGMVLYLELCVRIPIPDETLVIDTTIPIREEADDESLSQLAHALKDALDKGIWQNPEICREYLCQELHTNRTYLIEAIHELGYDSFATMINQKRMDYIVRELTTTPTNTITNLLFNAGYRNRTSAIHYFTQHFGVPPTEYIHHESVKS